MSVVQFYWIFTMFQVLCQVLYMQHCLGVCVRWFLGQLGCFRSAGIGAVYLGYSSVFTQCWWHFSLRIGFTEFENLNSCWATALFHQGVLLSARVYMLCDVLIRKTFASGWDPPGSWSDSFVYKDPPDHVYCCWLLFAVPWRSQCFLLCSSQQSWCGCWICMCKRRNGGIESWVSPVPPSLYASKRLWTRLHFSVLPCF